MTFSWEAIKNGLPKLRDVQIEIKKKLKG